MRAWLCRVLGTPNEAVWFRIKTLPNYKPDFPSWLPVPLHTLLPDLDAAGVDLLARMLAYEPARRISAKQALKHPYFREYFA